MGRSRIVSLVVSLALVGANLVALNVLLSGWSTARVDLTEEGLYSISSATKRLLTSLDEDVTIIGYFSTRTHPKLAPLVPRIEDLLEEYRAVSGGRIAVRLVDPGRDEAAEREAAERYGVQSAPFKLATKFESSIVNAYFSLVVVYADQYVRYGFPDLIEIRPAPDGDIDVTLRNPEYDLTRAIKKVVYGFRSTNELFERVDGTVRLTAIWTPDALPELFAGVPAAVRTAAAELEAAGGDAFELVELDPTGDEALQQQLRMDYDTRPLTLGLFDDGQFYLDAILDVGGRLERIPLLDEGVTAASVREAVEDSLRRNTPGFLKTVGVVSPDDEQLPPELRMQFNLPPQAPPRFGEIERFLEQDYSVARVELDDAAGVPTDVDVLLVIEPRELSERAVWNLDQYLMRGGRVILCAGRYEADFAADGLRVSSFETGLADWLAHHGVTIAETLVLDDRNQPLPIPEIRRTPFGSFRSWRLEPYPYLVQVRDDGFLNREIAASLGAVGIYWGSPLRIDETAADGLEVLPILRSSERSWTDDDTLAAGRVVDYVVPDDAGPQLLAVALVGRFESYWAEREPPAFDEPADPDEATPETPPAAPLVPLASSPETRLVVVANSAFVSDFVARALAQADGGFFVENLRFVQNTIDWSSLDNDLLEIRSRGTAARRLRRIDAGAQAALETAGYAVPVALLGLLAAGLRWRRGRRPLPGGPDGPPAAGGSR